MPLPLARLAVVALLHRHWLRRLVAYPLLRLGRAGRTHARPSPRIMKIIITGQASAISTGNTARTKVRWPYRDEDGRRAVQRHAVELKVWRAGRRDPLADGLAQIDEDLSRLGLDEGTLVIFDRRDDALPIDERVRFDSDQPPSGRRIALLRAWVRRTGPPSRRRGG